MDLHLPAHLDDTRRADLVALAERTAAQFGGDLLGLVLSGSAGRGRATAHSDLDVYVVLGGERPAPEPARSAAVDEIPVRLDELETVPAFGTPGWWFRWSFAWAPTLLDRADGRVSAAAHRQATLSPEEVDAILFDHSRLDGWLNLAYRALKSDRAGRPVERRLDAAESVPWLLDVVFTLEGRVRPYNSSLPWELREHPLQRWPGGDLPQLIEGLLDGDPAAIRRGFARLESACAAYDAERRHRRAQDVIDDWGEDLALLRSARS